MLSILRADCMKQRSTDRVFGDCGTPIELEGNCYKTTIRPAMLFHIKCYAIRNNAN